MYKEHAAELIHEITKLPLDKVLSLIERPGNPDFGDYAFPCFFLANPKNYDPMWKDVEKDFFTRKNPVDITRHLHDIIIKRLPKEFEKIEVKGPYLNFFVNKKMLAKEILKITHTFGKQENKKQKIMTEFCHANTHKAFHIGHTRNISLGESVSRILEFNGYKVTRTNYQGDVGMHVAKTLWGMLNLKKLNLEIPKENKGKWLGIVYAASNNAASNSEEITEEVNRINQKLFAGDKELVKLWKETRQWSIDYFNEVVYPDFGVKFDRFYFESEVQDKGVDIAKNLLKKGIAKLDQGAIVMDLKKDNLGIYIILKTDGTPLYSTKDLYLADLQYKEFKPDKIVHIVASEQNLYFMQLFKTLEFSNPKIAKLEDHLSYELVILPTGKMKSRDGIVVLYDDTLAKLIDLAKKGIIERGTKLKENDLEKRSRKIALGAIKYAMLSQGTNKVITFDEDEIMRFEGNTGPYLQYSYARASSILKKAGKPKNTEPKNLENPEIRLIIELSKFPETVKKAGESQNPSLIANYAHSLCQTFNEFYHSCPVIGNENEGFRLKLIESFRITLSNALYLLGIEAIEEM